MRFSVQRFAVGVLFGLAACSEPDANQTPASNVSESSELFVSRTDELETNDELLIDFRDDVTDADIAEIAAREHITLEPNSPLSRSMDVYELAHAAPAERDAIIFHLSKDPRVEAVEPNVMLSAYFVPNDPLYRAKQWHLGRVGAEIAWNYSCGEGVTVAVIDTGVACFDHGSFSKGTDLAGTRCTAGYNFIDNSPNAVDDHGHGTHVAGTIAQTTHNGKGAAGLAHCASLMPVKVLSKRGWGSLGDVAEGIRFAAKNGANVINLSLGGSSRSRILENAVHYALSRGVVVVAAAGNNGGRVGYPAAYEGVVAVSATDSNDRLAWFSSRGPEIAIAAPGVSVTQQTVCNGGRDRCEIFGTFSGTSMAAPHVAGAAALLMSSGVTKSDAVIERLRTTARSAGEPNHFGAGIVESASAVRGVYWKHIGLRMGAFALLALWLGRRSRKRGGTFETGFAMKMGVFVGAVGLFLWLPLLGIAPRTGHYRWVLDLLARPLGEWDMALGLGVHKWLPLASALPSVALTALFFSLPMARRFVGGLALGNAAFLVQLGLSAEVAGYGGSLGLRIFAASQALICLWLANTSLYRKLGER